MRMTPKERKEQLLEAGLKVAEKSHYMFIQSQDIADLCGVSYGTLFRYFPKMARYRKALLRRAIKEQNLAVIVQGMIVNDPLVRKVPDEIKGAAVEGLKERYGL